MKASDLAPVQQLLAACPFLARYRDEYWECGDTLVFGAVAQLLKARTLSAEEDVQVFGFFNWLAEHGDGRGKDLLATGAIETFNDDENSQRLTRQHLRGDALKMLEHSRIGWGQPEYGNGAAA